MQLLVELDAGAYDDRHISTMSVLANIWHNPQPADFTQMPIQKNYAEGLSVQRR